MAANDEFDIATRGFAKFKDYMGELILFTPKEYIEEVSTVNGIKPAIITDMVVISRGGEIVNDVMILNIAVIKDLKARIPTHTVQNADGTVTVPPARKMLGVVATGIAKKGQQAPVVLDTPTDEQQQMARDFLAGKIIAASTAPVEDDPFAVGK